MFQDWECPEELRDFISEVDLDENLFLLDDVQEDEEYIIAYLEHVGEISETCINEARDNYIGQFGDYYEIGEYFVDELDLLQLPINVRNYFDFEAYCRDISFDLIEAGSHYFWN